MIDYNINKKEIKQIYNYVKSNNLLFNEDSINYLSDIIEGKQQIFCKIPLLKNIIDVTLSCNKCMKNINYLFIARKLYCLNVSAIPMENELKDFFDIYRLVLEITSNDFINSCLLKDTKYIINSCLMKDTEYIIENVNFVYNLFENKNLVKIIFQEIDSLPIRELEIPKLLSHLKNYINKSRMYYNDELVYVSSINNFLDSIKFHIEDNDKIQDLINKQLSFDKRLAGIYEVDEEKIKELEDKTNKLEDKLEGLRKNADKNSDSYKQIEEETKKLLGDISKVRTRTTRKTFKIVDISEEIERKKLLRRVRRYNKEFRFNTNDTTWFCQEVIEKIGIEYVANNTEIFSQKSISIAYQNNKINELSQVLKLNPKFKLYNSILLNKENIELFGISLIATNFNDINAQNLVEQLCPNEIILIKQILDINPYFDLSNHYFASYINRKIAEEFTVEYIAKCNDNQHYTILRFSKAKELSKLSSILKLNSNFYIDNLNKKYIAPNCQLIDEEIEFIIKNCDVLEIIELFNSETLNFYNLHELLNKLYRVYPIIGIPDNALNDFISLSPEYRKKALNIDTNLNSEKIGYLFNHLVKSNANKLKIKKLIKK